jgi:hypothetical protein
MGTDKSGKVPPLERTNWAGALCKSQNTLEVVLSAWNSGFRKRQLLLLDWATIRFRFIGQTASYTGSFCVFGPVLSSPAHGAASLAMALQRIEMRWPQIGLGAQDLNDNQRPKSFQKIQLLPKKVSPIPALKYAIDPLKTLTISLF